MILTDRGLVPIEKVTTQMKLWDGIEYVPHGGIVFKGERNVIEYAGLTATPDHKVWSEHHWRTHGECAASGKPISCTGIEGKAVREARLDAVSATNRAVPRNGWLPGLETRRTDARIRTIPDMRTTGDAESGSASTARRIWHSG